MFLPPGYNTGLSGCKINKDTPYKQINNCIYRKFLVSLQHEEIVYNYYLSHGVPTDTLQFM